jgi:hypothetical protein
LWGGQSCLGILPANLPGKPAWQTCLANLPGKPAWQTCLAILPGNPACSRFSGGFSDHARVIAPGERRLKAGGSQDWPPHKNECLNGEVLSKSQEAD